MDSAYLYLPSKNNLSLYLYLYLPIEKSLYLYLQFFFCICPNPVDHSALKISFRIYLPKKGPGYWKLNNSVLNDKQYLDEIKKAIGKTLQEYQDLKSYQLIWELVKINIKEFSISSCKEKSRQRKDMLKDIQHQLDSINKNVLTLETKGSLTHDEKEQLEYRKLLKPELGSKQTLFQPESKRLMYKGKN